MCIRIITLNILCFWVIAFSALAEQLPEQHWVARYTGLSTWSYAEAIVIDDIGNVYVTGGSYNGTSTDYATIKYYPDGEQLWVAVYNGPANKDDSAVTIALDNSGNVFVTGDSEDSTGKYGYVTIKYDPNGNQLWSARYDGSGPNDDHVYDLVTGDETVSEFK
jgi:hypothetical protein